MSKEKPPEWVSEELERRKRKERLEQIKQKASEASNTPYIFVEGKGYFEVPAKVASQLTEPVLGSYGS